MSLTIANLGKVVARSLFNSNARQYFDPLYSFVYHHQSLTERTARVLSVRKERSEISTYILRPCRSWKGFIPGQFIRIGVIINGRRYERIFSISSDLAEWEEHRRISITVQHQPGGLVTTWMQEHLTAGGVLYLSEAMGDFTLNNDVTHHLFIAGGSGITPFHSMIREVLSTSSKSATLLYYAREGDHIFQDTWKKYAMSHRIKAFRIASDVHGRFSESHLEKFCPEYRKCAIYICGPGDMIETTRDLLLEQGTLNEHIRSEAFALRRTGNSRIAKEDVGGTVSTQGLGGQNVEVPATSTILDALEKNNIPVRSGCRMGICYQCQCEKEAGVVYNTSTGTFSEKGKSVIQPCISIPVGHVELNLNT